MKYFALLALMMMPAAYSAEACKVYGISDSPQKLDCSFRQQKLNLRCVKGQYFLDGQKVDDAFHMEVEEGPVPLAFKTSDSMLTVTIESRSRIHAELEIKGRSIFGTCRL